jgi:DNA-binding IclR family transcriptional regulator
MPLLPSAPAARLICLVEHLAASSGDELTASDLAKATGINRTTCLSLLLALEDHGWVHRRSGTKYTLGAALIPVGEAALSGLRVVDEVQPELDRLAGEIGMEALASTISNNDLVVIAHARGTGVLSNTVRVGQTIPFVPPFGFAHLIGAEEDEIERWLDRAPRVLPATERADYRRALALAATHGYIVVLDADSQRRFEELNRTLAERPTSRDARRQRHEIIAALTPEHLVLSPRGGAITAEVSQIQAPVHTPDRANPLAIGIHGLPHQIDQSRIAHYVALVTASARRLTTRLGGEPRRRAPAAARRAEPTKPRS